MVTGLSNFADGSHECHEEHCFICSLSTIAQRICSVFVSFQIITVNIFITLFALKELIFCDVIVRKPLLSSIPSVLPWNEILAASSALTAPDKTVETAYRSLDNSVLIDVYDVSRIYVEAHARGGRKVQRMLKRRTIRLLELILMDYYGVPCRVRFTAKERVFVAQFGK
jgi:hypothetical protein